MHSVLIKGGVLILGVVCTLFYVAGSMHSVLRCPHFRVVLCTLNLISLHKMANGYNINNYTLYTMINTHV